jgi:hypothetical protein
MRRRSSQYLLIAVIYISLPKKKSQREVGKSNQQYFIMGKQGVVQVVQVLLEKGGGTREMLDLDSNHHVT